MRYLVVLVLVTLACASVSTSRDSKAQRDDWETWKRKHNKHFKDHDEELMHRRVFEWRTRKLKNFHNSTHQNLPEQYQQQDENDSNFFFNDHQARQQQQQSQGPHTSSVNLFSFGQASEPRVEAQPPERRQAGKSQRMIMAPTGVQQVRSARPPAQQHLDEQVNTPFEQIVKSGLRPPLRMIVRMRNKDGHLMKVPVNLHGAAPIKPNNELQQIHLNNNNEEAQNKKPEQQQEQQATFQGDENTPVGGDIFDPAIVRPLLKAPKTIVKTTTAAAAGKEQVEDAKQEPVLINPSNSKQLLPPKQVPDEQHREHPEGPCDKGQKEASSGSSILINQAPPSKQQVNQVNQVGQVNQVSQVNQVNQAATLSELGEAADDEDDAAPQSGMFLGSHGDEIHVVLPKVAHLKNGTLANMFEQFQLALNEQMNNQFQHSQVDQQQVPLTHQQQLDDERQRQRADEQEDLMVASKLMASSGAQSSSADDAAANKNGCQLQMTVIKPPPGTSLSDALRAHATPERAAGGSVAVLQSIRGKLKSLAGSKNEPTFGSSVNQQQSDQFQEPLEVQVQVRQPFEGPLNHSDTASGVDEADGFASRLISLDNSRRIKRSLPGAEDAYGPLLEPDDRLANQLANRRGESTGGQFELSTRRHLEASSANSKQPARISGAERSRRLPSEESSAAGNSKKPSVGHQTDANNKDTIVAAASESGGSQMNDLGNDGEDPDSEDGPDSSDSESAESNNNDSEALASAPAQGSSGEAEADDEASDMGDDLDDAASFDSDDEPYNQGASSERDYNSPSFEIPQIDINPDSLKQNGCRTVLREVQEIPMNGLGVVQANGQPGSGYESSDSVPVSSVAAANQHHQLAGVRVRRQAGGNGGGRNENLINSRKVTSIVMTKECHFPNESPAPSGGQATNKAERAHSRQQPHEPVPAQYPSVSQRSVGPVSLESVQDQVQVNRLRPANAYQQPSSPAAAIYPTAEAAIRRMNLLNQQQQQLHRRQQLEQQPSQLHQQLYSAPSIPQPAATAHLATGPLRQYILSATPIQHQVQVNTLMHPLPHALANRQHANLMKRRSAPALAPLKEPQEVSSGPRAKVQTASGNERPNQIKSDGRDFYVGADSKRNEVVAQKLYKPPSDADPFHTLSYSSQNGVDPDPDDDNGQNQEADLEKPNPGRASAVAASNRFASESLSERERNALLDPNYDDTDPRPPARDSLSEGDEYAPRSSAPSSKRQVESDEADEFDDDNSDETRLEKAQVLAPALGQRAPLSQGGNGRAIGGAPPVALATPAGGGRSQQRPQNSAQPRTIGRRPEAVGHNQQAAANNQRQQAQQGQFMQRRHWPPGGRQVANLNHLPAANFERRHDQAPRQNQLYDDDDEPEEPDGGVPASEQVSASGRQVAAEEPGAQRFGKSFKFEHEVARPEPRGFMAQLRSLPEGRQSFVHVEGGSRQSRHNNNKVRRQQQHADAGSSNDKMSLDASASKRHEATRLKRRPIERPNEPDEEADERDDEDEEEQQPRRRMAAASTDSEAEDPDADPDYNPKEVHLPAHSKPKKVQKSFAYVHRDLPQKGSKNDDDFVVSYGRGNLQTEQEDYDSDRDNGPHHGARGSGSAPGDEKDQGQETAAASSPARLHLSSTRATGGQTAPVRPPAAPPVGGREPKVAQQGQQQVQVIPARKQPVQAANLHQATPIRQPAQLAWLHQMPSQGFG